MGDAYSHASAEYERREVEAWFVKHLTRYLDPAWKKDENALLDSLKFIAVNRSGINCYKCDFGRLAWLYRDFLEVAAKLKQGNHDTWAKLLGSLNDDTEFMKLKEVSPWPNKILLIVDYDYRDGRGDLKYILAKLIKDKKSWPIGKKVLVVLSADTLEKSDIYPAD